MGLEVQEIEKLRKCLQSEKITTRKVIELRRASKCIRGLVCVRMHESIC